MGQSAGVGGGGLLCISSLQVGEGTGGNIKPAEYVMTHWALDTESGTSESSVWVSVSVWLHVDTGSAITLASANGKRNRRGGILTQCFATFVCYRIQAWPVRTAFGIALIVSELFWTRKFERVSVVTRMIIPVLVLELKKSICFCASEWKCFAILLCKNMVLNEHDGPLKKSGMCKAGTIPKSLSEKVKAFHLRLPYGEA